MAINFGDSGLYSISLINCPQYFEDSAENSCLKNPVLNVFLKT